MTSADIVSAITKDWNTIRGLKNALSRSNDLLRTMGESMAQSSMPVERSLGNAMLERVRANEAQMWDTGDS